jgi:polysaccharide export outer membrane protein
VSDAGTITLPIVGKISVAGKTLTEVESLVVDAYYPKYVVYLPGVVCKVAEHRNERVFAVLGLVNKPNAFPYPANVQYTLMDTLAMAGGVDLVADPHYVTVHRQEENGEVVSATFGIDSKSLAEASNVVIKPGDVVFVDITPRTRTNVWLSQMLRLSFGAYVRPEDF